MSIKHLEVRTLSQRLGGFAEQHCPLLLWQQPRLFGLLLLEADFPHVMRLGQTIVVSSEPLEGLSCNKYHE